MSGGASGPIRHGGAGGGELAIGIDIGGTSIRAAVVDELGRVHDTVRAPTPGTEVALQSALDRAVTELTSRWSVTAVGLAVAGFLTADRQTIRFSPHLPWREARVAEDMSKRVGLPVFLEHDANSAAVAEYHFGAGRGRNTVVVTIGTGIGAGFLIDGEIYRGSFGVAPELGHLRVMPDGRPCSCGKYGCWERYCSGTALVDTVVEMIADGGDWNSQLAREVMEDPGSLTGRRIAAAAHDGDALALAAFADFARWLGLGLAMVCDVFDPDLVVIAGGVGSSAGLYLDEAREHYSALLTGAGHRRMARIRGTQLGEAAGMIGAAQVARTETRAMTLPRPGG